MPKRINFLEDLSRSDLDQLAKLFFFPNTINYPFADEAVFPPDDWVESQNHILDSFPAHLLRPTSFLPKLAMNMPFRPAKAVLCCIHKPLNPFLIRRIFMQLCAETGLRVQSLIAAAERDNSRKEKKKSEHGAGRDGLEKSMETEVRDWLRRLTTLNSLWMSYANYQTKFDFRPDDECFQRVKSGCMACILAIIGGNAQPLLDLRISLLGRKKIGHESRLWGLVETWVRESQWAEQIKEKSELVGKLVLRERRRIRRRQRKARREERLKRKTRAGNNVGTDDTAALLGGDWLDGTGDNQEDAIGEMSSGNGEDPGEAEERDFEGSVIDFYSSAAGADDDALHPALQRSMTYDAPSGTFHYRLQQPTIPHSSEVQRPDERAGATSKFTFYSQSAYSQDIGLNAGSEGSSSSKASLRNQNQAPPIPAISNPFLKANDHRNPRERHIAEKRAEAYQKLVGSPSSSRAQTRPQPPSVETKRDEEEERAANARVQKALADAYPDKSQTYEAKKKKEEEKEEARLTRWSGMMAQGGAKWLGS